MAADSAKAQATVRQWHGFEQRVFKIDGHEAWLVIPESSIAGKPWIWRARFPGYHSEMDQELVRMGFHLGYVDVAGLFGSPTAIERGEKFYQHVVKNFDLSPSPALEGVSRGGLFVYQWAAKFPERTACIYCDTPVLDFKSWPGGLGSGLGAAQAWKTCRQAWDMTEEAAAVFRGNPVDNFASVVKHKIPLLHIVSENDRVVPPNENTYLLKSRLEEAGHALDVISVKVGTEKSNGHHFTHPEPQRVVDFIRQSASVAKNRPPRLDLYLLAGQSNMAGRGRVKKQDRQVHPRVFTFSKSQTWESAVDPLHFDKPRMVGVGPGKSFAVTMANARPNSVIGLIPCAVGGSPIESWEPGGFHDQTKSHPWDDMLKRVRAAQKFGTLRGILWHQGESDSNAKRAPQYEQRLRALIARFRAEFGDELPFAIGQLGKFEDVPWKEHKRMVDGIHQAVAKSTPNCVFVSSAGLAHKGDRIHFSSEAERELGRRFAAAMQTLQAKPVGANTKDSCQ